MARGRHSISRQLINEYRAELDRLRAVSGSRRESVLREAFKDLLKRWGKSRDLQFIPEHDIVTPQKNRIYLDGALLHALRVPFGYWEAKDADDDLDAEIAAKTRKGYPRDNIVYSDDHVAVLIQDGHEIARVPMGDTDALYMLLTRFFAHERHEIADFNKAVKQFGQDLPAVLEALRDLIAEKRAASRDFAAAETAFLKHAQDAINPAVSEADVQEMLIQHILTEDIFAKVFDNPDFHRQNNVAGELYKLEEKLFGYGEKQRLLRALSPYYAGIARTAAVIQSHSEKQGFLKGLYENFYKVYNAKAADRLGVVYTPGEIVRFMIRSADWLCEKHFGRNLVDRGVEILDPATGTGTFIVELLEHFRGHHDKLRHKYKEELHANEVAILPYYVANLNIEATYQAITGQFAEFENLCFVDTLDNVDALGVHSGHQHVLFGGTSDENFSRIKRQNRRKISVIIGNPPYNANQQNENDNNKNRAYAHIDRRIKDTYIKASTAQKTKLYDMYARFYRWASDRLGDEGVLAFVTNRSFIESRTFDGFRKLIAKDFQDIWLVDLGGDVRANPKISGTKHNVFGIQTGVAIAFLVRQKYKNATMIRYVRRPEYDTAEDKLSWLSAANLSALDLSSITPLADGAWLDQGEQTTWRTLLAIGDKSRKTDPNIHNDRSIFKLNSMGIVTARDEWMYAHSKEEVSQRAAAFIEIYEHERERLKREGQPAAIADWVSREIKWTSELEAALVKQRPLAFDPDAIVSSMYRPFDIRPAYYARTLTHRTYQQDRFFPIGTNEANPYIAFVAGARLPFASLASNRLPNYALFSLDPAQTLARYRYTKSGERIDNITDWALARFREHYSSPSLLGEGDHPKDGGGAAAAGSGAASGTKNAPASPARPSTASRSPSPSKLGEELITKDAIFHYVYAVLHDPVYRETYALNLKREFPRIPFYPDFAQWAAWGEALMAMHIGYEEVAPWPVVRVEAPSPLQGRGREPSAARRKGVGPVGGVALPDMPHPNPSPEGEGLFAPKPILRSHPDQGLVVVDADTQITGIPPEAWTYRLGNRSAIDWVLDQHKEKKPRDPTIAAKFNTYRFADYKEEMIALLAKVVRVSVDTAAITEAMRALDRAGWDGGGGGSV